MPVEIAILSGAQQGGRWATDASRIVVGDAAACDICFDGDLDPGARGKRGVLVFHDDGWRFENHGAGSWLVNQTAIMAGRDCRLRSGDVVRVSEDGPDLRFTIFTAREFSTSIENNARSHDTTPAPLPASAPEPTQPAELPSPPAAAAVGMPRTAVLAAGFVFVLGLAFGLGYWPTRTATPVAVSGSAATGAEESDEDTDDDREPKPDSSTIPDPDPLQSEDVPSPTAATAIRDQDLISAKESNEKPSVPPDPGAIQSQVADAMVYLVVEIEGQKLPVCCGWAAAPNLVVSTAGPIAVLAEMQEKGQAVFAAYGDQNPSFVPVDELIVHPLFDKGQANAPASRAHNVGVATLKASLPKHCELELASALQKPATGMPLAVVAYALTTEPDLVPFNVLEPPRLQSLLVRIVGLETLAGATGGLPLLRLEEDAPRGMEGAPVFTAAGKVIGVLGGSAEDRHAILCDQLEPLLP